MGFLIWNIDNAFCGQIRQWRRQLGLPWGALLEGHAWWHLMTGVGTYFDWSGTIISTKVVANVVYRRYGTENIRHSHLRLVLMSYSLLLHHMGNMATQMSRGPRR